MHCTHLHLEETRVYEVYTLLNYTEKSQDQDLESIIPGKR